MATRVTVDTAALGIPWTQGTTYTVELEADFVKEVGNNRTGNPADLNFVNINTNNDGPSFSSSVPAVGATDVDNNTTITLIFNRHVKAGTGGEIRLYRDETSDVLLRTYTLPGDANVTFVNGNCVLNVTGLLRPSATYYVQVDDYSLMDVDGFDFDSGWADTTTVRFTTGNATIFPEIQGSITATASISESLDIVNLTSTRNFQFLKSNYIFSEIPLGFQPAVEASPYEDPQIRIRFTVSQGELFYRGNTIDNATVQDYIGNQITLKKLYSEWGSGEQIKQIQYIPTRTQSTDPILSIKIEINYNTAGETGDWRLIANNTIPLVNNGTAVLPTTFTFTEATTWNYDYIYDSYYTYADILLVGAGGYGRSALSGQATDSRYGGGGGGGGEVIYQLSQTDLSYNTNYPIVIGAPASDRTTTAFGRTADGGSISDPDNLNSELRRNGGAAGNGASGGLANSTTKVGGGGGGDGAAGSGTVAGYGENITIGTVTGTFGYGGGGGGGIQTNGTVTNGSASGYPGFGNGASGGVSATQNNGIAANWGGGGGGGAYGYDNWTYGGAGIVVVYFHN